jgi:hypothetical protein
MYRYINRKLTVTHVPVYQAETNSNTSTDIYINQKQAVIHVQVYQPETNSNTCTGI